MKQPLKTRIINRFWRSFYLFTHQNFKKIYSNRFSDSFNQADLEYCIPHLYKLYLKKSLDLNCVNTFNEKLNWLKCFYHNEVMTECADKVTAPDYFKKCTGLDEKFIVKNLGVFSEPKEIDFNNLPSKFVLKSNWGSGKQIIVNDKTKANLNKIRNDMADWTLKQSNHYYCGFEYGYKNIVPKIICEEFVDFEYKLEFFCFNGKPRFFWTVFNDKTDEVCADFYDAVTLKKIVLKHGYPNSTTTIKIPNHYNDMFDIASKLSQGFPFVRIDFFKTPTSFKFSEMTFYHWCGFMPFEPKSMDVEFGKYIDLPKKLI